MAKLCRKLKWLVFFLQHGVHNASVNAVTVVDYSIQMHQASINFTHYKFHSWSVLERNGLCEPM